MTGVTEMAKSGCGGLGESCGSVRSGGSAVRVGHAKPCRHSGATAGHGGHLPQALSHEALLTKSAVFARRSLDAKRRQSLDEHQLWAAGALELLAKAQLANIHPSLVVEPSNENSMLEANGISTGTAVRTIHARRAYTLLKHTVPGFSNVLFQHCTRLAERRNAELHSGEAACSGMDSATWEGMVWHAADLILDALGMDLGHWLGAQADEPLKELKEYRQAQKAAAQSKIDLAAQAFKAAKHGKLSGEKFKELVTETARLPIQMEEFRYSYDRYWRQECPACHTIGVAAGSLAWEEQAEDQSDLEFGYELVECGYLPTEFHCPTCKLGLVGELAMQAAGLDDTHVEQQEREIEYEPEYGND